MSHARVKGRGPTKRKPTPRTIPGVPGTVEAGYREQPLVEHDVEPEVKEIFRESHPDAGMRHFTMGACHILVSREPAGKNGELLWHLTMSTPSRHPSWSEIKVAAYRLLPNDRCYAMFLPPPEFYVNVEAQDHVFHVWECRDAREPWTSG